MGKFNHQELARSRKKIIRDLESDLRKKIWTIRDYQNHHARTWNLYAPGSRDGKLGASVVCRHVALELSLEAQERGDGWRIDTWKMNKKPGSQYGYHATVCIRIKGAWYYIESSLFRNEHHGHSRSVTPHDDEALQGLQLGRDGKPDVGFFRNIKGGRDLKEWTFETPQEHLDSWRMQYFQHRLEQIRQVRTGESKLLAGNGRGLRRVEV